MTELEYVAQEVRESLHLFDHKRDGNYSVYIAKVAVAAIREYAAGQWKVRTT